MTPDRLANMLAIMPVVLFKGDAMTARETEAMLLDRCVALVRSSDQVAHDQREANVFNVAAMIAASRFPGETSRLSSASEQCFAAHPGEKLASAEIVRRGGFRTCRASVTRQAAGSMGVAERRRVAFGLSAQPPSSERCIQRVPKKFHRGPL